MLATIYRERTCRATARPYSAASTLSHRTEYRLTDNDSLNSIRSNIHETFDNQNRPLRQIRELTSKTCSKYSKRIDRLCSQFNIGPSHRGHSFSSDVDVDFIAKRYINSKSKEKKKQQERDYIKKEITKISTRHHKKQPRPFFKFNPDSLRQMESRVKKPFQKKRQQHPYMKIYEQSQAEALNTLTEHNELHLDQIGIYAEMAEPEDWQQYQKQVKDIYSGVRTLRKDRYKQSGKKRSPSKQNFFIT